MTECKLNKYDRPECNGIEFSSGSLVEVFIEGVWQKTRIEFISGHYVSIDGYQLIGNPVRLYSAV